MIVDAPPDGARVGVTFGGCDLALVAALCNGDELFVHKTAVLDAAHTIIYNQII